MSPEDLSSDVLDVLTDSRTEPELLRKLTYAAEQIASGLREADDEALLVDVQRRLIAEARRAQP